MLTNQPGDKSPTVLSIAGFDPSSGAGITADVKTAAAHGCFALCCVTALTVQSTRGVAQVRPVDGELVRAILEELAADLPIDAVRVGMLGSGEVAREVAGFLEALKCPVVVLDPVLRASSGTALLDPEGLEIVRKRLLPLSTVVTPNIDELTVLTGISVKGDSDQIAGGERLLELGCEAAIVTGGHRDEADDLVLWRDQNGAAAYQWLRAKKLQSRSTHGTGCAFATSLACNLALGRPLLEAAVAAKQFVRSAIERAAPIGTGFGPMKLI